MSDELKSQLSAFVDDELTPEESELFVRRLCRDEDLRRSATCYNLIGDAIRGETAVTAPAGFVAGVMMAVEGQTVPVDGNAPTGTRGHPVRHWGFALAASVVVAAIALITLPGDPDENGILVADGVEDAASANLAAQVGAPSTDQADSERRRQFRPEAYSDGGASSAMTFTASAQNVPIVMPVSLERRAQLNDLLLQHYNSSGASRQPGLVGFRNVGFVTQSESQR